MQKWHNWVNILEKNPNKSIRELAKEFNKSHIWCQKLKTFYNATTEEKKILKERHPQYDYFYKVWKNESRAQEITTIISPGDTERNNSKPNTNLPRIPYYEIQDLKKVIKLLALENKHLVEENNSFAEDNLYKAKSINKLINEKKQLEEELKKNKLELKITKYSYYATVAISIILLITGIIKCSG